MAAGDWDVFISHASEDKDFARPLAEQLKAAGLKVWFDEYELTLGDSLRRSIDQGLANSRFGVVILSPHFFEKEWPQRELDGLAAREDGSEKRILPVWHTIGHAEVTKFSPLLAGKLAISTDKGLIRVFNEVMKAVNKRQDSRVVEPSAVFTVATTPTELMRVDGPLKVEPKTGEVRNDNSLKMKFVWCPAGSFNMGSPDTEAGRSDNERQSVVELTFGFWLGKYQVTQHEWTTVMESTPWEGMSEVGADERCPATFVSWRWAMAFCEELTFSERASRVLAEGWIYTLPTEAQWEYACRAGAKTAYSFGDYIARLGLYVWFDGNSSQRNAQEVGKKKPNLWGLHDMHGNVWEWCRDGYASQLPGGRDPEVTSGNMERVIRGGAWKSSADECRSASRVANDKRELRTDLGFRVILVPAAPGP